MHRIFVIINIRLNHPDEYMLERHYSTTYVYMQQYCHYNDTQMKRYEKLAYMLLEKCHNINYTIDNRLIFEIDDEIKMTEMFQFQNLEIPKNFILSFPLNDTFYQEEPPVEVDDKKHRIFFSDVNLRVYDDIPINNVLENFMLLSI